MRAARAFLYGLIAAVFLLLVSRHAVAEETPPSTEAVCVVPPAAELKPAVGKAKRKAATHLDQAAAAYQERQFAAAIKDLQAAYLLDPQLEVLFSLAQACREAGRLTEAATLYERTLVDSKDDATRADCERHLEGIHTKLATQEDERAAKYLREKEYSLAIAAWEQAYKFSPNAAFLFQIAQALRLGGQVDNAIVGYQRFLTTAPENAFGPEAKEHLARLQAGKEDARALKSFEQKQFPEAISAWEAAFQISAQPVFLFRIAESERLRGDKTRALAGYQRFLQAEPQTELPELRQQAAEQSLAIKTGTVIGRSKPVYKRWWFWTLMGGAAAVAIVGGVAGGLASRPTDPFAALPLENQRTIFPQALTTH